MPIDESKFFRETQRFRQWWVLLLLLGLFVLFAFIVVQQVVLHHPVGNHPVSDTGAIVLFMIFGVALPFLFLITNLCTEVRQDGLYIRFFPFHLRFKRIQGIQHVKVHEFSPLTDYGGWGIRYGNTGKAYIVQGNRGVLLGLNAGKALLIGSQHPDELEQAISVVLNHKSA
jgi:hypothetical protein